MLGSLYITCPCCKILVEAVACCRLANGICAVGSVHCLNKFFVVAPCLRLVIGLYCCSDMYAYIHSFAFCSRSGYASKLHALHSLQQFITVQLIWRPQHEWLFMGVRGKYGVIGAASQMLVSHCVLGESCDALQAVGDQAPSYLNCMLGCMGFA